MKGIRDYCTIAPDGWNGKYWGKACMMHDEAYAQIKDARKQADLIFWEDMNHYSNKYIAKLYYIGVRIFGRFVL